MIVPYTNLPLQGSLEWPELSQVIGRVINKGNFILGEEVAAFEKEFAEYCGVKHAIGVANGTDSLVLCLRVLGIGEGDEVITAPNSWISTAAAIHLVGAKPVFVDVGPDQLIDVSKIDDAVTPKTKAIIPVHLTGRLADMDFMAKLAEELKLFIVEDSAQAIGASRDGYGAGAMGLCSYSLHPLKNLNACGDAGIITTNNDAYAEELKLLRNHGLVDRDHVKQWGYNSRLDELHAAILRYRLRYLEPTIARRREIAELYYQGLSFTSGVTLPVKRDEERHTYHVFVVMCEERDQLREYLTKRGVETKIHYPIPIHLQECAADLNYSVGTFPSAEWQAGCILSLPINQYLTDGQIEHVVKTIKAFYES